jgi:hypothetical protein
MPGSNATTSLISPPALPFESTALVQSTTIGYPQDMKKCLIFIVSVSFAAALSASCRAQELDPSQMSRKSGRRTSKPLVNE